MQNFCMHTHTHFISTQHPILKDIIVLLDLHTIIHTTVYISRTQIASYHGLEQTLHHFHLLSKVHCLSHAIFARNHNK